MNTGIIIGVGLLSLLVLATAGRAGEIPREPLDRLWEEHMLAGTFAFYYDGQRRELATEPESAGGSLSRVAFTKHGIVVSDLRETRYLGLWLGGGWKLKGGLLQKAEDGGSTIEFYGKRVTRMEPHFILDLTAVHVPTEEDSYEFFLLQRTPGAAHATILKKWVFPPEDVPRLEDGSQMGGITGHLQYDRRTKTATIVVKGLTRPFEDRVNLSELFRQ